MATDLVIVDLYAQRNAVLQLVEEWNSEEVLAWLEKYGTLQKIKIEADDRLYSFRAHSGNLAWLRFDETDRLVILHPR